MPTQSALQAAVCDMNTSTSKTDCCRAGSRNEVWPMGPGKFLELCVPNKVGSARWSQLAIRQITGRFAKHYPEPQVNTDLMRTNLPCRSHPKVTHLLRLMIVRNPYERLLSGFLDKMVGRGSDFHATPGSFANFTALLRASDPRRPLWLPGAPTHMRANGATSGYAHDHLAPITSMSKTGFSCHEQLYQSFHRNGTAIREKYRVVRLEEMERWYPPLVEELDIRQTVLDPKWPPDGCYWKPQWAATCADGLDPAAAARAEHNATVRAVVERHRTGSASKLAQYFATQEVIDQVTAFVSGDLEAFEYPVMKLGSWATLSPPPGPPRSNRTMAASRIGLLHAVRAGDVGENVVVAMSGRRLQASVSLFGRRRQLPTAASRIGMLFLPVVILLACLPAIMRKLCDCSLVSRRWDGCSAAIARLVWGPPGAIGPGVAAKIRFPVT